MFDGTISINNGIVLDTNINRSPASYLLNSEEERAQYEYNVDKELVQLKFTRTMDNKTIGAINWYPVHPTSMNNTNCLVTSDNVGYASILLENYMNPDTLPGNVTKLKLCKIFSLKVKLYRVNLLVHLHQQIWVMFRQILKGQHV